LELGIYQNVELLSSDVHSNVRVREIKKAAYAKYVTDSLITADEFFSAARSQPIVFAKGEDGKHFAAVLLGLGQKSSWFVDANDMWKTGEYMPAFLRRYPFVFVKDKDKNTDYLAIDKSSEAFNEQDGEPLFTVDGKPSKFVQKVLGFMQTFEVAHKRTQLFCDELQRLDLLETITINKWVGFQAPILRNIKRVNESRLDKLTKNELEGLVEKGYYKLISAHLISLGNIERISK
jgi:hypothetical protein